MLIMLKYASNMLVTSICPAPSFATASTISHFLLEMYILVNGACHFNGKAHYCYCSYFILLLLLPLFFRRATPPAVFVTEP